MTSKNFLLPNELIPSILGYLENPTDILNTATNVEVDKNFDSSKYPIVNYQKNHSLSKNSDSSYKNEKLYWLKNGWTLEVIEEFITSPDLIEVNDYNVEKSLKRKLGNLKSLDFGLSFAENDDAVAQERARCVDSKYELSILTPPISPNRSYNDLKFLPHPTKKLVRQKPIVWENFFLDSYLLQISVNLPLIQSLNLCKAQFTDEILLKLVCGLKDLRFLNLSYSSIRNEGLAGLKELRNSLVGLDLSGIFRFRRNKNCVIDFIIENFSKLKFFNLKECGDFSCERKNALSSNMAKRGIKFLL
ncbi:hypothetical protein HK099_002387 [Clydaea vesicula]|uniref:Uncharacterized protein n=1 Tax=Clydaea vesicula TaxID=447962 RepID=A0AAD5XWS9_9FUNG|nr:hypothetical protein HK099_002387 [Clydaea vesicula]